METLPPSTCHTRVPCSYICIGILIFIIDQISKGLVSTYLPVVNSSHYWYPYGGVPIFQDLGGIEFSIDHMTNTGAAWGVLGGYQFPLLLLRVGLVMILCLYLFFYNRHSLRELPLIFIIAGAMGNIVDYFIYGHVIDMFHFVFWGYDFPIFNVADSSISVGIFSLFTLSFFEQHIE